MIETRSSNSTTDAYSEIDSLPELLGIFEASEKTLQRLRISLSEADAITLALANGQIPEGYDSLASLAEELRQE